MHICDEHGNTVDIANKEKREQDLSAQYIMENDTVLELGARYGSVSCTINSKLISKTNQVVVEPDYRVWDALERNKNVNNCQFNIVKGFISSKKLSLIEDIPGDGYTSTYVESSSTNVPSFTLQEIKEKYNLNFNALVADCEGFLEIFFDENPDFYDNLRLIIFEEDCPEKCNYNKIREVLRQKGFTKIVEDTYKYGQNVWIKSSL
jgi:FkbM family methyltransferase